MPTSSHRSVVVQALRSTSIFGKYGHIKKVWFCSFMAVWWPSAVLAGTNGQADRVTHSRGVVSMASTLGARPISGRICRAS